MEKLAATLVVTVSVAPGFKDRGLADEIVGLVAGVPSVLNRYGGL